MNSKLSIPLKSQFSNADLQPEESLMISYMDVFVLMATLFVMVLIMSRVNLAPQEISPSTQHSETPSLIEQITQRPAASAGKSTPGKTLAGWQEEFQDMLKKEHLDTLITVTDAPEFTELVIASRVLFDSGEAELTRAGTAVLTQLLPAVTDTAGMIYVEGHTDDLPIYADIFPSNWELASARANAVLKFFVAKGLEEKRIRAVSFADSKPIAPNTDESNRQKNRRVNLVIHRRMKG